MPLVIFAFFSIALKSALAACYVNRTWSGQSYCFESRDAEYNVLVDCRLENMTQLDQLVPCPDIVYSLDISTNGLTNIEDAAFYRFTRLVKLNLAYNNIRHIPKNAFNGLSNLNSLDISYNALLTWNTSNITKQLPALSKLDVTGNPSWVPGQHIRDLPNITVVKGIASYTIPHTKYLIHCDLHKRHSRVQSIGNTEASAKHVCFKVVFSFADNFTAIWASKFLVKCQGREAYTPIRALNHPYLGSSHYSIELIDFCFQKLHKWAIHNIIIGLVAIVINAVVMATIILSPSLKKNIDMLFFGQLSMGDFLQGLYLVILASLYRSMSSSEYFELKSTFYCDGLSILIQSAWCLSMSAGFLVTLDRYICVVYSMKPSVRIRLTHARLLIIIIWITAVIVSCLPLALKIRPFFFDYSCSSPRFPDGSYYSAYIGYIGVIFYVLSYILYIRIFCEVRKASLDVGIQREGRLAKRIILVISSNVVFLLVPSVAGQFLTINNTENWELKLIYWNAVVLSCFGINSFLNPLLYPFRCQRFTSELKRLLRFRKKIVGVSKINDRSDISRKYLKQRHHASSENVIK